MPGSSEGHAATAPDESTRRHGEVEALDTNIFMNESVESPKQGAQPCIAFELVQSLGVNAVGDQCGTDAVSRHVADQQTEKFYSGRVNR